MNSVESRLIYCNENFALVNKLPGEMCSFDEGKADKRFYIPEIFKSIISKRINKTPECVECVNRIDRPVSGLVLLAVSEDGERILKGLFAAKEKVIKKYWAIVEGIIEQDKTPVVLKDYMYFNPSKQKSYICEKEHRKSKYAELVYVLKGAGERYSYLEIQLKTGRTHQIRAQLAEKNLHIRGDLKYGAKRSDTRPGIRLHSAYLSFEYPGDKRYVFSAPVNEVDALWNDALRFLASEDISSNVTGDKVE